MGDGRPLARRTLRDSIHKVCMVPRSRASFWSIRRTPINSRASVRSRASRSLPSAGLVRFGAAVAWTGLVRAQADAKTPASWPREIGRVTPAFLSTSVSGLAREVEAIPDDASTQRASSNHLAIDRSSC